MRKLHVSNGNLQRKPLNFAHKNARLEQLKQRLRKSAVKTSAPNKQDEKPETKAKIRKVDGGRMRARSDANSPRVLVKVTQKNINEGVVADSGHCIVAEAVKAAYPEAKYVSVDVATIRFTDKQKGKRYVYLTPRRAQESIINFDQGLGDELKPFQMTLQGGQVYEIGGNSRNTRPRLVKHPQASSEGNIPPVRVGGKLPPVGALSNSRRPRKRTAAGKKAQSKAGKKTGRMGRRREFGLRAMSK